VCRHRQISAPEHPERRLASVVVASIPAVVRRGHLTLQQVRHAVDNALRGQTFEADA